MNPMDPHVEAQLEKLRALPSPRELSPLELARVERGIGQRLAGGRRRRPVRMAVALAAALLAPLAFAAVQWRARSEVRSPQASAPAAAMPAAAEALPVSPEAAPSVRVEPKRLLAQRPSRPTGPAPAEEPESPLAAESRLLSLALRQLRQENAPAAALLTLDQYQARFPAGQLRRESELARVDALLATGERGRALRQLEAMEEPAAKAPRAIELSVLRAELLAEAGRHTDALPRLDRLLAGALPPALEERALIARASCRSATGHPEGAREDLRGYLDRFPGGRFAERARAQLGE